ncbi:MAG: binding-protein-dependent transport system inner rane protein [Firmicutes bacterium]|nr:binding-protein-dependent transport system inner rane protein [Bacillota bacterium]
MFTFAVKRLLWAIPTLLGVTVATFLMIHLIPGNVVQVMLGTSSALSPRQMAELSALYGLDRPLWTQYLTWLSALLRGDLGFSLRSGVPAGQLISQAFAITMELTVIAMLLSLLLALTTGIVAAVRRGGWLDLGARAVAIIGLSIPHFWLGTMLILGASLYMPSLSTFSFVPFTKAPLENLRAMILPAFALGLSLTAIVMRQTRAAMLEVLAQPYIQTARSKGLHERAVIFRHALRNALIPIVTIVGLQFGYLLGGAVVIENVFALPGVGRVVVNAINQRDYPLVQGSVFLIASLFVVINLLVDIAYGLINPRVRYQ